jgi:GT2 family glycosyltransferase
MNDVQILIGIVTHNRADILPKAIESALAQSAKNVSVAVIDDGSTDATPDLEALYPQVNWQRRSAPEGYMSARNEFMRRERFDFFISLDDDAWFLESDEIALALEHFQSDPSLAAVAFDILSPDQPELRERTPAQPTGLFIGCGHMLRLSAVRRVGGYDATPGGYGGEEKDLCLRLMDAGYKIVRLPGLHVWHDKTPIARDIPRQHRSGVCNDLTMAVRRSPLLLIPLILSAKFCRHFVFSWREGLLSPCISGFVLFARSQRSVWTKRRPVQTSTLRAYARMSRN